MNIKQKPLLLSAVNKDFANKHVFPAKFGLRGPNYILLLVGKRWKIAFTRLATDKVQPHLPLHKFLLPGEDMSGSIKYAGRLPDSSYKPTLNSREKYAVCSLVVHK